MKVDLKPFQTTALKELRINISDACDAYNLRKKTQVVSLQAPTGSGKTIIAAALIESIYTGMTLADGSFFEEQPNAIFVWLSDSPQLNEQSKQKIEALTSRLTFGQCKTIQEDSFDQEMLDDGCIYFLNTQKISSSGNLSKHSDGRQFSIWETIDNTIEYKGDHLYLIIDEAHRGSKSKRESGTDTTIMQRFIRGYEHVENEIKHKMRPMPVILGISATAQRFNTLVSNITNVGLQTCVIPPEKVRESGLLKDRIVITYPENPDKNNDIVLLDAAIEEWQKKCLRWHQYTSEQKQKNVDPVLVIQVCQGSAKEISSTNLDDIIAKIEEKVGDLKTGEVVHCFGEGQKLVINGLDVYHKDASDIADDHKIKVVLFKESLSTGWDCPRAEAMMSYATRNDPTYIAQLLGRMIRTPLQCRVSRDDFLNDVKLYLPHFDKANVKRVVEELQSTEGSEIPTEINGESLEEPTYVTYTIHRPKYRVQKQIDGQLNLFDQPKPNGEDVSGGPTTTVLPGQKAPEYAPPITITVPASHNPESPDPVGVPAATVDSDDGKQLDLYIEINREEIVDYINHQGFLTYLVRQDRINDYMKSLLDLSVFLTQKLIDPNARINIINDVVKMIRSYIEEIKANGSYSALASKVLQYDLSVQIFDPFGKALDQKDSSLTLFSESDLDRQLRNADIKLGSFGFPSVYGQHYYDEENPNAHKIDCILFAADDSQCDKLAAYAKTKFNELAGKFRLVIVNKSESIKKEYHDILADSDIISEQLFTIPENVIFKEDDGGKEYDNHLLVPEETGVAKIHLNSNWEYDLIEEESKRPDFVCWLRNPAKAYWALRMPYEKDKETKSLYPDFLIIRHDNEIGYIVDILEPHGSHLADNLAKAKALAKYAKKEDRMGRIQLIHKSANIAGGKFVRLDLTDLSVRDKVLLANTDDELTNIFITEGKTE